MGPLRKLARGALESLLKTKGDRTARITEADVRHEIARRNAVEMLGLPEENTAMDRARALNFDVDNPLYHGTLHDLPRRIDIDRSSAQGFVGRGFYMTPSPEDASINYASVTGPDVRNKLINRLENNDKSLPRSVSAVYDAHPNKRTRLTPRRAEKIVRGTDSGDHLGAVYPVVVRKGATVDLVDRRKSADIPPRYIADDTPEYDDLIENPEARKEWNAAERALDDYGVERDVLHDYEMDGGSLADLYRDVASRAADGNLIYGEDDLVSPGHVASSVARALGADTVRHPTQFGRGLAPSTLDIAGEHTIALRPEIVRSLSAAFDPARVNEADMLGNADIGLLGGTAGGLGAASAYLMGREPEKKAEGGRAGDAPARRRHGRGGADRSIMEPLYGLADMGAGALRGMATTALGTPGEIEAIARLLAGGDDENTLLPTTDRVREMLPPVVPKGAGRSSHTADVAQELGSFIPPPGVVNRATQAARRVAAAMRSAGSRPAAVSRSAEMEPVGFAEGGIVSMMESFDAPDEAVEEPVEMRIGGAVRDTIKRVADKIAERDLAAGKRWVRNEKDPKKGQNDAGLSREEWERRNAMQHDYSDVHPFKPEPVLGIEDIAKRYGSMVLIPGDSTITGRTLTSINGLKIPGARLYGGPNWSRESDDLGRPGAWMSRNASANALQRRAIAAADGTGGRPVLGMYGNMGHEGANFAMHTSDALLQAIKAAGPSRAERAAFSRWMREDGAKARPDFRGLDSPSLREQIETDSDLRKFFVDRLSTAKGGEMVGVDGRAVIDAVTEPALRDLGTGNMGFRVVEMDPSVAKLTPHPARIHTTYDTVIPGRPVGQMRLTLPWQMYMPDVARSISADPRQADYGWGTVSKLKTFQPITQQMVDEIGELEREVRLRRGYEDGGAVEMSTGGAARAARRALAHFRDQKGTTIDDWRWRPMSRVREDMPITEVPDYVQGGYGQFMLDQASRAAANDLNARDLIKAYTITRSSVNRGGLPYDTATKTGMVLPRTDGVVRPEGAFSEWLLSPQGQRYLNAAERGEVDERAIRDLTERFSPFGMQSAIGNDMRYAAETMPVLARDVSRAVTGPLSEYRRFAQGLVGVGPSKSGFMASLIGRGDLPTFDARQIRLHTGAGSKEAAKFVRRGGGAGGDAAVDRMARRQRAMDLAIDPALDPHYQHLAHHAVWDAVDGSQTTHEDLVRAMRAAGVGGAGAGLAVAADDEPQGFDQGGPVRSPLHGLLSQGILGRRGEQIDRQTDAAVSGEPPRRQQPEPQQQQTMSQRDFAGPRRERKPLPPGY